MEVKGETIEFSESTLSREATYHFQATPEYRSRIDLGNFYVFVTRRFNWLQKKMVRWFFGWVVTDV